MAVEKFLSPVNLAGNAAEVIISGDRYVSL